MKKISIIGNGSMAKAIAITLKDSYEIEVVGRNEDKLNLFCEECGIFSYSLLSEFSMENKNIILAVKPYVLELLELEGKADTIFSVMAGKNIESIKRLESAYYIRTMPNVAAAYGKSTTTITGDEERKALAIEIFSKIGKAIWVDTEKELDISTAIAGSGPAFLALVAEAIADGGVLCGLKRELSYELTSGLFESFASIQEKPSNIKDMVMSPAGTTATGYFTLEDEKVRGAFIKAIKNSYEKSQNI